MYDWLIVGAGFSGSVLAERLATQHGAHVLVVDRRNHVGGNAYDRLDENGVLIHQYGPHIFHTNSDRIFAYLSQFTQWRPYEHRVLAAVDGMMVPIPINRTTVNRLYDLNLKTDLEMEAFFRSRAEDRSVVETSEDVVVSVVGWELYEKFFKHYTRKQWGLDPSELDKSVTARVPTRTNDDDRYFADKHQYMPRDGYTEMFKSLLADDRIDVRLGVEYRDVVKQHPNAKVVYTGQIDEYFDFCHGALPYRSLSFEHVSHDKEWHQPVGVVNYPQTEAYTRVTEYKHLTGQNHPATSLTYEHPSATGDPYYPIPRPDNYVRYKKYEEMARQLPDVHFVGRLATYRYYNMDQVVGQALATFEKITKSAKVEQAA